jgi:hypothetical protein
VVSEPKGKVHLEGQAVDQRLICGRIEARHLWYKNKKENKKGEMEKKFDKGEEKSAEGHLFALFLLQIITTL